MMSDKVYEYNPSLPRLGKSEFSTVFITRDLYKSFPNKNEISYEEFLMIWDNIAKEIVSEVCTNSLGVKLPNFLGELKIQYLPYKRETKDFEASKATGRKVEQTYLGSKGKVGSIVWERRIAKLSNKFLNLYSFEPSQKKFRDLAREALLKTPNLFREAKLKFYQRK